MSTRADGQVPAPHRAGTAPTASTTPSPQEAAGTRAWLAKHLRWHHDPHCWHCRAATIPTPAPAALRSQLDRDLDTAERAAADLDEIIARFDTDHGDTLRAALQSLAVTSGSRSLNLTLNNTPTGAPCSGDTPDEAGTRTRMRLRRIRGVHAQLVAELNRGAPWRDRPALDRAVQQLADAWNGTHTANPRGPLAD